jgi:DNA-binding NarL/FixJ family response regulator
MNRVCLIVDDHRGLRHVLEKWLSGIFPDFSFHTVATAEEAIELASTVKPGTIIMDVSLPQMNGIEATRLIKRILPQTKIIIHTIHEEAIYKERAAQAGADFYISKKRTQIALLPALESMFSFDESKSN